MVMMMVVFFCFFLTNDCLKEYEGEKTWGRGVVAGRLGGVEGGELWSGCIVQEKNLFSIILFRF